LCVEVDQFDQISALASTFVGCVVRCKCRSTLLNSFSYLLLPCTRIYCMQATVDTAEAVVIEKKILTLVRSSTEIVKFFTLQVLRSKKDSLKGQHNHLTSDVVADAVQSRKRARRDDDAEAGEDDGANVVKRVRVDEAGTSNNSCSSGGDSGQVNVSESGDTRTSFLSALDALYSAVLHTEVSTTTDMSTKNNMTVEPSTQILRKIIEKMVHRQEASVEDVNQLFVLYFK